MNKFIVTFTIIIVVGLLIGVTTYKVVDDHNKKVLLVQEKYIIEKAKDCINQKKCSNDTITLKELYEKNYLDKQVNKVTKEFYNENSYVEIKDSMYRFIILP